MKKTAVLLIMLLCAASVFAGAASLQIGFSLMGINAGTAIEVKENVKVGVNASVAKVAGDQSFGWIYAQALLAVDTIHSESNDFDLRFGASYLNIGGTETVTYYDEEDNPTTEEKPTYLKFAGITFGIQYTHWFGEKRSHGIFVGIDVPVGGYVSYVSYGTQEEHGPFVGPLTSFASLGVLLTSFRTGYTFQF